MLQPNQSKNNGRGSKYRRYLQLNVARRQPCSVSWLSNVGHMTETSTKRIRDMTKATPFSCAFSCAFSCHIMAWEWMLGWRITELRQAPEVPKAPPAPEAKSLYGYGPKDQASREPGTCRFLCLNSDLEGKEKQWLKRLASSKVLEEDVSRTYGRLVVLLHRRLDLLCGSTLFQGGRDSSGSIAFE